MEANPISNCDNCEFLEKFNRLISDIELLKKDILEIGEKLDALLEAGNLTYDLYRDKYVGKWDE